jgi:hypothetical protein
MTRLWFFVMLSMLIGCKESESNIDDASDPFSPPIITNLDFLLEKGYSPVKENVDVTTVRMKFSDSVNLYYQFDDIKEPPEFFISEIILPSDSLVFLQYLDHYNSEIISKIRKVDSLTYSFYVRNNSNHMFFSSSLTRTDSTLVLQNIYSMPFLSKTRNTKEK